MSDKKVKINVHEDPPQQQNLGENEEKIKKETKVDFWYGASLFGRILFTLYSIHEFFLFIIL